MADTSGPPLIRHHRSDWIRLRTFIVLRWIAIAGQITALTVAARYINLQLDIALCVVAVGLSAVANLVLMFAFPENKRLTEIQVMLMFLFDIAQLGFLLFLTGGLHNPFSLLVLVPVAISATVLQLRAAVFLGLVTFVLTSFLALYHLPLRTMSGTVLEMPAVFVFGFWVAILIGTVFLGFYERRVTTEIHSMSEALLATQMALSREQKLTDLGGVVAATAHELGTPLATIKLASSELIDELDALPELKEDAELIRAQADRCRDILHSMGRIGKDDLHLRYAPITAIIDEAAEPHLDRGKTVLVNALPLEDTDPGQPEIRRQPEIIHGLRNLIQNAVDFADSTVWVDSRWTDKTISIRIIDDGDGFAPHLLGRIGDPFVRQHLSKADRAKRPGYTGMGLGLFIAKTLLERSGAELKFTNGCDPFLSGNERPERCGAVVDVCWPRSAIGQKKSARSRPLGENKPLEA